MNRNLSQLILTNILSDSNDDLMRKDIVAFLDFKPTDKELPLSLFIVTNLIQKKKWNHMYNFLKNILLTWEKGNLKKLFAILSNTFFSHLTKFYTFHIKFMSKCSFTRRLTYLILFSLTSTFYIFFLTYLSWQLAITCLNRQ